MGQETAELVKLGAASFFVAVAVRFLWKYLRPGASEDVRPSGQKPAAKAAGTANGAASPSSSTPEEGVWIYFGSQSGTAEGFAKELEEEASGHDLKAHVVDLEDFDPEEFAKHRAVVLVVATYGEGDPTDNAVEFYKWLQDESLEEDMLKGVQFTVMGLGNRQYVNFNSCARIADKELMRLGAECIYERGEGDDDQNIEEDFEQWKGNGLWPALQKVFGVGNGDAKQEDSHALETAEVVASRLPLRAHVNIHTKELPVDPLVQVGGADVLGKWYFGAAQAPVKSVEQLRQVVDVDAGLTTKHIDVDVSKIPSLDWKTADNLDVLPCNPEETVNWFAQRLGVEAELDSNVSFTRAPGVDKAVKKPFPTPCTVREALALYCDLCVCPSRAAMKKLAAFAKDPADHAALEKLLHDTEAYKWMTGDGVRLSLREMFELLLPTADFDFGTFLQLCPRQKSRPYTIASSSRADRNTIGLCVSMVQEKLMSLDEVVDGLAAKGHSIAKAQARMTSLGEAPSRCFRGACSTMLCTHVSVGDKLWVAARPSTFRLPRRTTTPVVMIGAGTGIAPFKGFVQEFASESSARPKTLLFFGCTKRDTDFLYKDVFQKASNDKVLGELVTAFSREQAHKVYVQHRLGERGSDLAALAKEGAHFYVCGSLAMGAAVREELAKALGNSDYVTRLHTEGRFIEELW